QTIIYANVLVCCFAGLGIKKIMEKKWKLSFLKDIMVYILLSGILVSAIYHINLLSTSQPSPQMMNAAKWLEKNSDKSSVVLSREENSYFIQYFGNKKVLYDSLSRYDKNFKTIKNDSEIIYHSRNLKVTEELLKKYGIRYILIDNEMLNRDVWEGPNDGLLFLLTNKEKFATVYNQGGIQIWYYTMV
ncbi:hypothetical protein KY308_04090, partial [Candidatus Woesearchaeota archaeon]|nr:hypothetical protein [Candidatus Woesearchaeota archaeon]